MDDERTDDPPTLCGGGDSRYARQRARLREAAEAIAAGRSPEMDLQAIASLEAGDDAAKKSDVAAGAD